MHRIMFILWTVCLTAIPGAGETFFICTSEMCGDEIVPLDEQVREGILDGLFEEGHIVLDDCLSELKTDILETGSVGVILAEAIASGIRYTVIVRARTKKSVLANRLEHLETVAEFALYDAEKRKLIASSRTSADNSGREESIARKKLWFELGHEISAKIQSLYAESLASVKERTE